MQDDEGSSSPLRDLAPDLVNLSELNDRPTRGRGEVKPEPGVSHAQEMTSTGQKLRICRRTDRWDEAARAEGTVPEDAGPRLAG